jgi:hypothetical protein
MRPNEFRLSLLMFTLATTAFVVAGFAWLFPRYICAAYILVVIAGVQGFWANAGAWDARERGRSPIWGLLLGILFGPVGYVFQSTQRGSLIPEHHLEFAAMYFLLFLYVLSVLNSARMALGGG